MEEPTVLIFTDRKSFQITLPARCSKWEFDSWSINQVKHFIIVLLGASCIQACLAKHIHLLKMNCKNDIWRSFLRKKMPKGLTQGSSTFYKPWLGFWNSSWINVLSAFEGIKGQYYLNVLFTFIALCRECALIEEFLRFLFHNEFLFSCLPPGTLAQSW